MKEIKVIQNWRGRYNLLSNEETLSFSMGIFEDNKLIEIDEVKARLYLNEDIEPFDDPLDNIGEIYQKCYEYADRVFGSTDYKAQCLLFAKLFQENFEELCNNRIEKQRIEIADQLKRLQNKFNNLYGFDDISYEVNNSIQQEINKYKRWIQRNEEDLEHLKQDSDRYKEIVEKNAKYQSHINKLENSKIKEDE